MSRAGRPDRQRGRRQGPPAPGRPVQPKAPLRRREEDALRVDCQHARPQRDLTGGPDGRERAGAERVPIERNRGRRRRRSALHVRHGGDQPDRVAVGNDLLEPNRALPAGEAGRDVLPSIRREVEMVGGGGGGQPAGDPVRAQLRAVEVGDLDACLRGNHPPGARAAVEADQKALAPLRADHPDGVPVHRGDVVVEPRAGAAERGRLLRPLRGEVDRPQSGLGGRQQRAPGAHRRRLKRKEMERHLRTRPGLLRPVQAQQAGVAEHPGALRVHGGQVGCEDLHREGNGRQGLPLPRLRVVAEGAGGAVEPLDRPLPSDRRGLRCRQQRQRAAVRRGPGAGRRRHPTSRGWRGTAADLV